MIVRDDKGTLLGHVGSPGSPYMVKLDGTVEIIANRPRIGSLLLGSPLAAQARAIIRAYSGSLYVPNDANCFQDSAGTTPATKDSVVGLLIDQGQGGLGALGPELVTNGGFDTDTSWTKSAGMTITGGEAVFTACSTGSQLYQSIALGVGTYECTFTISEITEGLFNIYLHTSGIGLSKSVAGTYTERITIATPASRIAIRCVGTSTTGKVDNISVRKVPGIHATQGTTGFKPFLRKGAVVGGVSNGIGPWWLDFDGTDDVLAAGAFGAGFASSTLVRSNYGAVQTTTTAQDLSAGYNMTVDNSGLIVVPDTVSAADLAVLQRYANALGGYSA